MRFHFRFMGFFVGALALGLSLESPLEAQSYRARLRSIVDRAVSAPRRDFPNRFSWMADTQKGLENLNPTLAPLYKDGMIRTLDPRVQARTMRRLIVKTDRNFRNLGHALSGDFRASATYAEVWEETLKNEMVARGFKRPGQVGGTLSPNEWQGMLADRHIPLEPDHMRFGGRNRPNSGDEDITGLAGHGQQVHVLQALLLSDALDPKYGKGVAAQWVSDMGHKAPFQNRFVDIFHDERSLRAAFVTDAWDRSQYWFWLTMFDGFHNFDQVFMKRMIQSGHMPFLR